MRGRFSGGSTWTTDRTCPATPVSVPRLLAKRLRLTRRQPWPALVQHFKAPAASMASWTSSEAPGSGTRWNSWVSTQPNQQVDPSTLGQALGPETVQRMSSHTGLDVGQLLPLLAAALPQLVNMQTPNGNVPSGGLDQAAGPNIGGLAWGGLLGGSGGTGSGSSETRERARRARWDAGRGRQPGLNARSIPSADARRRRV